MNYLEIESVIGREILDSRGIPPLRPRLLWPTARLPAAVPPPALPPASSRLWSCATATRAGYLGKGVTKAVENINTVIADAVVGMDASDIYAIDAAMLRADGTKDKSNLAQTPFWRSPLPPAALPPLLWKCPCTAFWAA